MTKFVCIDTCVFTDCCLLETKSGEIIAGALDTLLHKLDSGDFALLLPEVIRLEFPKAVASGFSDIKNDAETLKTNIKNRENKNLKKLTERMRNNICEKIDVFVKETESNITETKQKIESIFANKNTKNIPITPELMMEAYKHFITGKKPKSDKGGGGIQSDCIIILSVKKFLESESEYELFFCSSNSNDFAESKDVSDSKIHSDIDGLFTNIKLYNNLFDLLNTEFQTDYKAEFIEKIKEEAMKINATNQESELTGIGVADQSKVEDAPELKAESPTQ